MKFRILMMFLLAPLLAFSSLTYAEDEESEGVSDEDVRYLDIKPAVVTNYGGVGRMIFKRFSIISPHCVIL